MQSKPQSASNHSSLPPPPPNAPPNYQPPKPSLQPAGAGALLLALCKGVSRDLGSAVLCCEWCVYHAHSKARSVPHDVKAVAFHNFVIVIHETCHQSAEVFEFGEEVTAHKVHTSNVLHTAAEGGWEEVGFAQLFTGASSHQNSACCFLAITDHYQKGEGRRGSRGGEGEGEGGGGGGE
jgi:hypothetical protein